MATGAFAQAQVAQVDPGRAHGWGLSTTDHHVGKEVRGGVKVENLQ